MFSRGRDNGLPAATNSLIPAEAAADLKRSRPADPYRSQAKAVRPLTFVVVVQGIILILLALVVVNMFPLIRYVPVIATVNGTDAVQVILEPVVQAQDRELFERRFVAEYVVNRETISPDLGRMKRMFEGSGAWVRKRSSDQVFADFRNSSAEAIERFMRQGFSRSVQVDAILRDDDGKSPIHTYRVNFTLQDQQPKSDTSVKPSILRRASLVAFVDVALGEVRMTYAEYTSRGADPTGFKVVNYRRIRPIESE